jgi:hypothetical protein
MGWWSAAVMGGDTPADFEGKFLDIIGFGGSFFDRFGGEELPEAREVISKKFNAKTVGKIERWIDREDPQYFGSFHDDRNIAYQVLGVMIMRYGVAMDAELKKRIIQAAKDDDWSKEDGERKAIMKSFIADLKKYDNKTPTELTEQDQGLFGAIGKALAKNKEGLVNR